MELYHEKLYSPGLRIINEKKNKYAYTYETIYTARRVCILKPFDGTACRACVVIIRYLFHFALCGEWRRAKCGRLKVLDIRVEKKGVCSLKFMHQPRKRLSFSRMGKRGHYSPTLISQFIAIFLIGSHFLEMQTLHSILDRGRTEKVERSWRAQFERDGTSWTFTYLLAPEPSSVYWNSVSLSVLSRWQRSKTFRSRPFFIRGNSYKDFFSYF